MYQFFSLRKSQKDKNKGTIIESIFDDRTPVSRKSIGYKIPVKLWDGNNEKVKMNEEVDYILINSRIQMLKNQFSQKTKTQKNLTTKHLRLLLRKRYVLLSSVGGYWLKIMNLSQLKINTPQSSILWYSSSRNSTT